VINEPFCPPPCCAVKAVLESRRTPYSCGKSGVVVEGRMLAVPMAAAMTAIVSEFNARGICVGVEAGD